MRGSTAARPGEDDRIGPARLDDAAQALLIAAGLVHHRDEFEAALGESRLQRP